MTQPTEKRTWRKIYLFGGLILLGLAVLFVRGGDILGLISAKHDDARTQNDLGRMYYNGEGHYAKAFELFTKSAEQGFAAAQSNLGTMYSNGHGVPQDYRKAVHWLTKSAEQGHAIAQSKLGLMYDDGRGVPRDYKKAYMWNNLAIHNGDPTARIIRDIVAKELSSQDLIEAQEMTKHCLDSGYKIC